MHPRMWQLDYSRAHDEMVQAMGQKTEQELDRRD